ncbi:hypothetical protein JTB14_003798 [Gonioctena quinquepunctata]|nr:hypothetical protein JTB14_003798 [Gonioctena quinquepunctata]
MHSLNAHGEQLKKALNTIGNVLDVIVLTETWGDGGIFEKEGYRSFYSKRTGGNKTEGVVVYIRETFEFCRKNEQPLADFGALTIEVVIAENYKILITSIYRPHMKPRIRAKRDFVEALENYLKECNVENHIIIGDININIDENSLKAVSKAYLEVLRKHDFVSLINEGTHFVGGSGERTTCIDHIFLKSGNEVRNRTGIVCDLNVTEYKDHKAILAHIQFPAKTAEKRRNLETVERTRKRSRRSI